MTIQHMRIVCGRPNSANTHSGYVTLIAVPVQQVLQESSSILRYKYIAACPVHINIYCLRSLYNLE